MADVQDNAAPEKSTDNVESVPDDFIPKDAWPVCPNCMTPCDPRLNYCPHCDSNEPMNPLASYMPFERIRFDAGMYGRIWKKVRASEDTSLVLKLFLILVLLLGAPVMLAVGLPLLAIGHIASPPLRKVATFLFLFFMFTLLCLLAVFG